MKGLDLSKFQKISEDEKVTQLQHPDGHQITIAHASLSPKLKDQLKSLKMAKGGKVKMMAAAGAIDEAPEVDTAPVEMTSESVVPLEGQGFITNQAPIQDMDPASPALAEEGPKNEGLATQTFEGTAPVSPEQPVSSQALPQAEQQMGPQLAQPISYTPPTPEEQKAQYVQHYAQEGDMWNDDLAKGLIKPQTYASMFHDKSTLGKVGTIFGMMLSSMGSGLTHQPNQLMELMQKQIDNDLQAQKASVGNKQSFYQLNMQQKKNEADVLKTKADTLYQQGLASKIPAEKESLFQQSRLLRAQARNTLVTADLDSTTLSNIQGMGAAFHSLATSPFAQTPQGQQTLGMMFPIFQKYVLNKADAAAGAKAFANMTAGGGEQGTPGTGNAGPVDMQKFRGLQMSKVMPEGDVARANEEASHLMNLGEYQSMYNDGFNHLNNVSAGKLLPADREAAENSMLTALVQAGIPEAKAKAFVPQPGDTTQTRRTKQENANKAFQAELIKAPTLMRYGLIRGGAQASAAKKQSKPASVAEGPEVRYDKQGNKWVKQKDGTLKKIQ